MTASRTYLHILLAAALAVAVGVTVVLLSAAWLRSAPDDAPTAVVATTAPRSDMPTFPPATLDSRPDLSASGDHVEVCGVGWVKAKPLPEDPVPKATYAAADAALDAAAQSLLKAGSAAERAAAFYMLRGVTWQRAMDAYLLASPGCAEDAACVQRATEQGSREAAVVARRFAHEGLATLDPRFYALAYHACGRGVEGGRTDAACTQFTAVRWAQLDASNAAPWLLLADAAHARKDAAARDEALLRASKAAYSDPYFESLFALAEHPLVRNAPPATRLAVMIRITGLWAAFPHPQLLSVSQACSAAAVGEADRRQMCSDLAQLFTERSTSPLQLALGIRIGERVGWPAERLAAPTERLDALNAVQSASPLDWTSCAALARAEAHQRALLRHGELGAAERQAASTGRTTAELAAEWRAKRRPGARTTDAPKVPAAKP